jgi:riboflavin kinase/FMN adenylyltransferase
MKILTAQDLTVTRNAVCGIGSYDGVHRGHQAIVQYLKQRAGKEKACGIITFLPLPFVVLRRAPAIYLTLKSEKESILESLGVDFIFYFTFTDDFARFSPEKFVDLVTDHIAPSEVVVGDNFHFGFGGQGSAKRLVRLADKRFAVQILPRVKEHGTISSTRIRELLLLGNVAAANRLLGRPYTLKGAVVKGKGKGAALGFPTINLQVSDGKFMPLDGVYKVEVVWNEETHLGAMFLRQDVVEVHIIGFEADLYHKIVSVHILERVRGVEHFATDVALKEAIARDIREIIEDQ